MQIIEIKALENGAHSNQTSDAITSPPPGWAVVPDEMELPETFPFVTIEVEGNVVTRMTAGVVQEPAAEPEPTQLDRLEAQVVYTAMMTDTLMMEG